MDFLFQRTYKSQGYYNGPLGINWDHNYNLWLRKVDGNQKIVRLTGGFQESTYVKHELHNYWVPPPGEHSIIIDISDMASRQEFGIQSSHNCHYGLRLSDGTVYFYEKDLGNPDPNLYRIKRIEDRFGNYLEFGYGQAAGGSGNRLQKVYINNPARVVSFEYDTLDRIISIKDYKERKKYKIKGRIWRYTYDDLGDLIAFTTPGTDHYPEGLTERYVYSTPYYTGELQHNLVKVYDTAGRMYLENEYGTDTGLLSFNRVVRQREGCGERYFEYEDISLAIGSPVGQTELEEDWPAYQTVMMRRNGHPVHYIYNKFGNLIAREEDTWSSGTKRRLVTHYRYNRDGALIGEVSPEGRITQYLYERDEFMTRPGVGNLDEDQLRQQTALSWKKRLSFGNRLAVVRRAKLKKPFSTFQFPGPTPKLDPNSINPEDIIVKFTYDDDGTYQNIESVSDPRYTDSPFAGSPANPDPNPNYTDTLTTFKYGGQANAFLQWIKYPKCKRDGQFELTDIKENFLAYDSKGRLTDYEDPAGTRMQLAYYPAVADPTDPEAPKEVYLHSQTTDPKNQNNPDGLNLKTEYEVNEVGAIMLVRLPKNTTLLPAVSDHRARRAGRKWPTPLGWHGGSVLAL
jgi:YD repeat-containing protein